MRLSAEDLEKIKNFAIKFLGGGKIASIFNLAVGSLIRFLKEYERTKIARVKLKIAKMIDEIESKPKLKKEDKMKIEILKKVMETIEEEEKNL